MHLKTVLPEHVQQRCFSSVIESKEKNFSVFVIKTYDGH